MARHSEHKDIKVLKVPKRDINFQEKLIIGLIVLQIINIIVLVLK